MQVNLGKIRVLWRGAYSGAVQYSAYDAVSFGGSSFICVATAPITGTAPVLATNTSSWHVMTAGVPDMTTRGQLIFRGASGPQILNPGTKGYALITGGPAADPYWGISSARQASTVLRLPDCRFMAGAAGSGGAIMADETLRVWGAGTNRALGQGLLNTHRSQPMMPAFPRIASDVTVTKWVRSGEDNWCLMSDGSVYVWGYNAYGALGLGNTSPVTMPTKVAALNGLVVTDISAGVAAVYGLTPYTHALFLLNTGQVYACGYNGYGQLGLGDTVSRSTPTLLAQTGFASILAVGAQYSRSHGIGTNGTLWSWGYNAYGELGVGNNVNSSVPLQVTLPEDCLQVSGCSDNVPSVINAGHTIALLTDGRVYSWGRNAQGQSGIGTTADSNSPNYIPSLGTDNAEVQALGGGYGYSIVRKTDGTIRTFGYNGQGQLGVGDLVNASTPRTPAGISGHSGIRRIVGLGSYAIASTAVLFNDGALFVTGDNSLGQLGVGDITDRTSFSEVPLMRHSIIDINAIGVTTGLGFGLLTDNGLYFQTGSGVNGLLGEHSNSASYVPFQITF